MAATSRPTAWTTWWPAPRARQHDARRSTPVMDLALALALDAPARRKQRQLHPALLPGLFFAFVLLLILLRLGRVVELFYPAGAVLVGLLCYQRSPTQYVSFLCWLYFLSPEVRRIADFSNGAYNPISPIQLAPSLVA